MCSSLCFSYFAKDKWKLSTNNLNNGLVESERPARSEAAADVKEKVAAKEVSEKTSVPALSLRYVKDDSFVCHYLY